MKLGVIISSLLGLPLLYELVAQGVTARVAVPHTPSHPDESIQIAQAVSTLGVPLTWLHRQTLRTDLLAWLGPDPLDAVLVFTLPWRIPATVLSIPRQGFLNVHLAPLPAYRGPEPLFWLLRNGETAGAVTIHRMDANFDTGPVLLTVPVPIDPKDTHGLHRAKLAQYAVVAAHQLLTRLWSEIPLEFDAQDDMSARYWPRAGLADVCVDWEETAVRIDQLVKAVNPWNRGALTTFRGQCLRLLGVTPRPETTPALPGTIVWATPQQGLGVACGQGQIVQLDMVSLPEGYFSGTQLAGLGLQVGEVLTSFQADAVLSG
ncbi:methionyl-tRNA formyltransferase [Spirosoma oryzicola]|uniref:methionyl-tRNA formyltransferase n=1 Tax=Spirosoma oryzicola TaxID=2898794 RepID=UPI001E3E234B|nr:formyltransferase family protein [Spirosoma oryzicola]UHG93781.1 hypothetical protein LQ777_24995 [Spirosoma oryzicola]